MANKKLTIRQQAQLLVQNILAKNTLSANEIFKKLILEAEQLRQKDIRKLILQQDEQDDLGDESLDDEGGDDLDEGGDQESAEEEGGDESDQSMTNAQVQQVVDDSLAIQCEINAKRITVMFDTIAELKKALETKELDPNSKEYIKFDITISYYSDKLQEFQGKTNPGVDQSKLEEALDKITEALEQLKGQLGIEGADVNADVDTPEQVSGDSEQNDQTEQEGSEQGSEEQEDLDQEQTEQGAEESEEPQEQLE